MNVWIRKEYLLEIVLITIKSDQVFRLQQKNVLRNSFESSVIFELFLAKLLSWFCGTGNVFIVLEKKNFKMKRINRLWSEYLHFSWIQKTFFFVFNRLFEWNSQIRIDFACIVNTTNFYFSMKYYTRYNKEKKREGNWY